MTGQWGGGGGGGGACLYETTAVSQCSPFHTPNRINRKLRDCCFYRKLQNVWLYGLPNTKFLIYKFHKDRSWAQIGQSVTRSV